MTPTFLINATEMVSNYLDNYNIWCDYQSFYKGINRIKVTHSDNGIPCYHYSKISKINQDISPLIAIDCMTEGLHSQQAFKQYNNKSQYLIFSNGWWDTTKVSLPIDYELIHHYFFLFEWADTSFSPNRFCFYFDKAYDFDKVKPCEFVCLIGNQRPERDFLIETLSNTITYNNFILRYGGQDLKIPYDADVIDVKPGEFNPYTNIIDKYYFTIGKTLPIDLYNQGNFLLVVESDLDYSDEFFLTEKTIKALITGTPFVLAATPFFLKHLHKLGFKTYNNFWDESYDEITDFRTRMQAIAKLCNDLGQFDWKANQERLRLIQLENVNNFFNLNKQAEEKFIMFEEIIKKVGNL